MNHVGSDYLGQESHRSYDKRMIKYGLAIYNNTFLIDNSRTILLAYRGLLCHRPAPNCLILQPFLHLLISSSSVT